MQVVLLLSWTFSITFFPDRTGVLSLRQQQQDFRCCRTVCLLPGLKSVELFGPSSDACSELRGGVFQGLLVRGPGYSKRGLSNLWKVERQLLWCLSLQFDVLVICERSHFTEVFLLGYFHFLFLVWCISQSWGILRVIKIPFFSWTSAALEYDSLLLIQLLFWWEVVVILQIHVEICITGPSEQNLWRERETWHQFCLSQLWPKAL